MHVLYTAVWQVIGLSGKVKDAPWPATIIILMFPLALGTALYRYRWHIRLVLYEAYVGRGDRWRRLQELHFR
nr:hypothetical protein BaRGS_002730 [Batillaria attramentaria]